MERTATQPPPPQPRQLDPNDPAWGETIRKRSRVGTLADLFSVLRMDKQNALVRRLVRKQQDGTIGQPEGNAMPDEEDDTPDINLGEIYNYINAPEGPKDTTPGGVNTQPPQANGTLAKAILPIALSTLIGGGLGGLGVGLISGAFSRTPTAAPAPVIPSPGPDRDTQFDLRFRGEHGVRNNS